MNQLDILDLHCLKEGVEAELIILGASGILLYMELQNRTFRPTRDIDVNLKWSNNKEKLLSLLAKMEIDVVGGVMDIPPMEDFQGKDLFQLVGAVFGSIKVYVPSIELLACSKLFSTRGKDLKDLHDTDILNMCDLSKLIEMVEEYKLYMINLENPEINVHQLEVILLEKGLKEG
jgi:hypothetical protein